MNLCHARHTVAYPAAEHHRPLTGTVLNTPPSDGTTRVWTIRTQSSFCNHAPTRNRISDLPITSPTASSLIIVYLCRTKDCGSRCTCSMTANVQRIVCHGL